MRMSGDQAAVRCGALLLLVLLAVSTRQAEAAFPPLAPPVEGEPSQDAVAAVDEGTADSNGRERLEVQPAGHLIDRLFGHGCGGCGGCGGCSVPSCGGCMVPSCGGCMMPAYGGGYHPMVGAYGYSGGGLSYGGYGLPGGYENRIGRPYFYQSSAPPMSMAGCGYPVAVAPPVAFSPAPAYGYGAASAMMAAPAATARVGAGDLYNHHFGPGYYRQSEMGHYRYPYYSYRRPWYNPGPAVYSRDTNLPW